LKFFTKHHGEIARMLTYPVLNSLYVVNTVVSVFYNKGDFQTLLEFALVHQTAKELCRGGAQQEDGTQGSECVLVPMAEDTRSGGSRGNPRYLIAVGHHRFRFSKRGGVSADHGVRFVGRHHTFHQGGCLG